MVFARVTQKGDRVVIIFNGTPANDSECVAYFNNIRAIYEKKERFLIMYDARNVGWLSWKHIHMQAEFMQSMESQTALYMRRGAIVVNNRAGKVLLTALFKMRKPVAPVKIFLNHKNAKDFLREGRNDNTVPTEVGLVTDDELVTLPAEYRKGLSNLLPNPVPDR